MGLNQNPRIGSYLKEKTALQKGGGPRLGESAGHVGWFVPKAQAPSLRGGGSGRLREKKKRFRGRKQKRGARGGGWTAKTLKAPNMGGDSAQVEK